MFSAHMTLDQSSLSYAALHLDFSVAPFLLILCVHRPNHLHIQGLPVGLAQTQSAKLRPQV